jgi:hypothetical protein
MQQKNLLLFILVILTSVGFAQAPRYVVEEVADLQKVYFNLKGTAASCNITPKKDGNLVSIYCNGQSDKIQSSFDKKLKNNSYIVNLKLQEGDQEKKGSNLAYCILNGGIFNSSENWNVHLVENKLYNLNLTYGIGNARVDLSGLSVEKLKIHTGSAKVKVGSYSGFINPVVMDTFLVKVDLGMLEIEKLNLSRAKNIIADVGFGTLTLDFSDKTLIKSNISANVGAGSLNVYVPNSEFPVIIYLNDSPLCHVKIAKNFRKLSPNVYVNESYKEGADNLLTFNVDVAMGNIVFKAKE